MYDIGSRLKEMRENRGLTQKELAERISKSVSAISGYESNTQTPPTDVLISICLALHVPITYFVDLACNERYSSSGFTEEQTSLLDLLFKELTSPTHVQNGLSPQQVEIVRKMILLFSS